MESRPGSAWFCVQVAFLLYTDDAAFVSGKRLRLLAVRISQDTESDALILAFESQGLQPFDPFRTFKKGSAERGESSRRRVPEKVQPAAYSP